MTHKYWTRPDGRLGKDEKPQRRVGRPSGESCDFGLNDTFFGYQPSSRRYWPVPMGNVVNPTIHPYTAWLVPWRRTPWWRRVGCPSHDPANPILRARQQWWRRPPNRRPVVAGTTGAIRSMVTDERIYPIISTPATLSVRGTAPCSPPDYAKIRRQHLGERAKRQTLRRDRRWGMQARINDNKRKNKTAFTVPNNRNRPFPKGRSLARVSCYFGPRWSLLTLLTYVRPRTYQICTHVMDHIIHSLIL